MNDEMIINKSDTSDITNIQKAHEAQLMTQ